MGTTEFSSFGLYIHNQKDPELIQLIRRLYIYISGYLKRTIKADHILDLEGLGFFCYYSFINPICKIRL